MHRLAARQRGARAHRCVIGMAHRVAETYDPRVIHEKELKNGANEIRILGPFPYIIHARTACPEEDRQEVILPCDPRQGLQSDLFGKVLLHGFRGPPWGKDSLTNVANISIAEMFCLMRVRGSMLGKVLIADWAPTSRIETKAMLCEGRCGILMATSPEEAITLARGEHPQIILLNPCDPGSQLLARLKSDPELTDIPVLAVCPSSQPEARLDALCQGADEAVSRPLHADLLLARIRSVLRSRETAAALAEREETVRDLGFAEAPAGFATRARVVLIAESFERAQSWENALRPVAPQYQFQSLSDAAMSETGPFKSADLFVLQVKASGRADALGLLSDLRSGGDTRHAGILVVHDPDDADTAARALDVGANCVIASDFDPSELAWRLDQQLRHKRKADRLRTSVEEGLRLAMVDPLTGLFNRRYALTYARRVFSDNAPGRTMGVILADIDRFKRLNDRWGHPAGDAVLSELAHRLRENVRGKDTVARIGGEEFLVLLPNTEPQAVLRTARRIGAIIRETPFTLPGQQATIPVTISVGVALAKPAEDLEAVIERADRALYAAKEAGRDRVTVSEQHAA